jgi:hypothetical protein
MLGLSMEIQENQGCGALFELCVSTLEYTRQRVLFLRGRDGPDLPTLDLFEFSLQFGCGSQLKLRDDFVCVEIDAHDGDPEVKFAGMVLPLDSTPTGADQRHGFQSARGR